MEAKKEVVGFLGPKASYTHQVSGLSQLAKDFSFGQRVETPPFLLRNQTVIVTSRPLIHSLSRPPSAISQDYNTTSGL